MWISRQEEGLQIRHFFLLHGTGQSNGAQSMHEKVQQITKSPWLIVIAGFSADALSKAAAQHWLTPGQVTAVIPHVLWAHLAYDQFGTPPAARFMPAWLATWLACAVILAGLGWLVRQLGRNGISRVGQVGVALLLAGGLAVFIDVGRFDPHGVTGFIMIGLGTPNQYVGTFNVANLLSLVGFILFLPSGIRTTAKSDK
jgi:lipoprotein signal peptidase